MEVELDRLEDELSELQEKLSDLEDEEPDDCTSAAYDRWERRRDRLGVSGGCLWLVNRAGFTLDTYTHVTEERQRGAADKIGVFINANIQVNVNIIQAGERAIQIT